MNTGHREPASVKPAKEILSLKKEVTRDQTK
jgi:hypothetical protein